MASLESAANTVAARAAHPTGSSGRHAEDGAAAIVSAQARDEAPFVQPSFRRVSALSTSAMERLLGLPVGAWKKRRLFALRVLTDAHAEAGIPRGAQVIVEPGSRATPGRLVLVRRATELTIQKVEYDGRGRTVIASATPGTLPFPDDTGRQTIVGTIIGMLPRARAADRFARRDRRRNASPSAKTRSRQKTVSATEHARHLEVLRRNLDIWTDARRASHARRSNGGSARRHALANRLRVLASCIEVAHQTTLYEALAAEANRIILAMRRELSLADPPAGGALELLGSSSGVAQTTESGSLPAGTNDAAGRYRTPPPGAALDTGLTAMV